MVEHLRDPGPLRESMQALVRRHAGYLAKPEHDPMVSSLPLEPMASSLSGACRPELSAESAHTLQPLCAAMIAGAVGGPRPSGTGHTTRSGGDKGVNRESQGPGCNPHRLLIAC